MSWSPEGGPKFSVFREKGHQLKYAKMGSTHTAGTLPAIPSGVLNSLAKLTFRNPSSRSEEVETIYPDHANARRKAGLVPLISQTMGELWKYQYENMDIDNEREPGVNKKINKNVFFALHILSIFLILSTG